MEGNPEQLSSSGWDPLFEYYMENYGKGDVLSTLYSPIPDDYFDGKDGIFVDSSKKEEPRLTPFVRKTDLNNGKDAFEDNKPKNAWEIGFNWKF